MPTRLAAIDAGPPATARERRDRLRRRDPSDAGLAAARMAAVEDPDPIVRAEVVTAIRPDRVPGAMAILQQMSADRDVMVRLAVIDALYAIRDEPARAMLVAWGPRDASEQVRLKAAFALAAFGGAGVEAALDGLGHDPDPRVRTSAARLLAELRRSGHPRSDRERRLDLRAVVERRSQRATEALALAVDDPAPDVRAEAAYQLGHTHHVEALALLTRLSGDAREGVRVEVVYGLEELDQDEARNLIIDQALNDAAYGVRSAAITALGKMASPEARAALDTLSRDPDRAIRARALAALGEHH